MADPAGWLYGGVRLARSVAVTDGYCLDVFQAVSDVERTYDWLLHPRADGPATCDVAWGPIDLPDRGAYTVLSDPVAAIVDKDGVSLRWRQGEGGFRVDVSAGMAGQLIRAGWPTVCDGSAESRELFFYRIRAAKADFAALYQISSDARLWRIQSCRRCFNGQHEEVRVAVTDGADMREHVFRGL